MEFRADLHTHSHFSRATSRDLDPEHMALWACKKGLQVVGTGDFTHPGWISEIQDKLVPAEPGLYRLRPNLEQTVNSQIPDSCAGPARFLLSGEISCIYKKNDKTRKVHHLILMPNLEAVQRLNSRLDKIGNIHSDGRPILGLDSRDLLEIALEASDGTFFIPAHIWTPWFSVFGSKSGFDTLEECFEDLTPHIHALETGLSSDPPMNRRHSALDKYLLVSNSDAHSPPKLGREANLFDTEMDYEAMVQAMRTGAGFLGTIEFFPEEGKYHLDGHRKCPCRLEPAETKENDGLCPVCGRPVTVGVLHRIHDLSDRVTPQLSKDFFSLIPLPEVLSELLDCGPATKKVRALYEKLLMELGPELDILMEIPLTDIQRAGGPVLSEAIDRMRRNQVIREGGYDGEYGVIRLFDETEKSSIAGQTALFSSSATPAPKRTPTARLPKKDPPLRKKSRPPEGKPSGDVILGPLNPEQRPAVTLQQGHLLVAAGPGTGKTLTLTHRIAYLIRQGLASPQEILALTFTRKAAREMARRISALISSLDPGEIQVSTFHRFCLEILRAAEGQTDLPPGFTLCSEWDARLIADDILGRSGAPKRSIRSFWSALPALKLGSVLAPDPSNDPRDGAEPDLSDLESLFQEYQSGLRQMGMLDLEDLEVEAFRLFQDHPEICEAYGRRFPWIFVDEYQDTNRIQVELIKALVHSHSSTVFAIGDPDQAIYGFRGSDAAGFNRFAQDFPGTTQISLTRNYRSTPAILRCAAALLKKDKPLEAQSPGNAPVSLCSCRTDSEEAEMIVSHVERLIGGTTYFSLDSGRVNSHDGEPAMGFGDIGVLFRLNAQGEALEEAFRRAGIPFVRSGERPLISRHPVNLIWRFLQTRKDPDNVYYADAYAALAAEADLPPVDTQRDLPLEGSIQDRIEQAVTLHGLDCTSEESQDALNRMLLLAGDFQGDMGDFLDALSLERGIDHAVLTGDRVALMSLHAAKGLEWPVVFITGCEDRLIPCALFGNPNDPEEQRLFYVGMTRAGRQLILSHAKRRVLNGRVLEMWPSPFLKAIPSEVCAPLERREWRPKKRAHQQLELF